LPLRQARAIKAALTIAFLASAAPTA